MQYQSTIVLLTVAAAAHAAVLPQSRASQATPANLRPFKGALGGIPAISVTNSGDPKRPFAVDNTTDVNKAAALQRSCSVQHNQCANAANANKNIGFSVGDCEQQEQQCNAAGQQDATPEAPATLNQSCTGATSSEEPSASTSSAASDSAPAGARNNFQTFTGALGGIAAIPVTNSGDPKRPFAVDGTTDVNKGTALQRSCAVQHNQCANAANANKSAGFSVSDCDKQETACNAAGGKK